MQLKAEKKLFKTEVEHFLYPGPEEQFHFHKSDCKIGWIEGAPKIFKTGKKVYVLTVFEVLEKHRGNGYSLEMLNYIHMEYKCPVVPVKVHNVEYWDHALSKYGDDFFLHAPLSNHEFDEEVQHWKRH